MRSRVETIVAKTLQIEHPSAKFLRTFQPYRKALSLPGRLIVCAITSPAPNVMLIARASPTAAVRDQRPCLPGASSIRISRLSPSKESSPTASARGRCQRSDAQRERVRRARRRPPTRGRRMVTAGQLPRLRDIRHQIADAGVPSHGCRKEVTLDLDREFFSGGCRRVGVQRAPRACSSRSGGTFCWATRSRDRTLRSLQGRQ